MSLEKAADRFRRKDASKDKATGAGAISSVIGAIESSDSKRVQSFSGNDYVNAILENGEFAALDVSLPPNCFDNLPTMKIERVRKSMPYKDSNGFYRYQTTTHTLTPPEGSSLPSIYLACDGKGWVDAYAWNGEGIATFIANAKVSLHVVDPIMALECDGTVFIAFNAPTEDLLDRGVSARMPKETEDGSHLYIASGRFNILSCNPSDSEMDIILRSDREYEPYYLFAASDDSGAPSLYVANLDASSADNPDSAAETLGFHSLFKRVFGSKDDEVDEPIVEDDGAIPVGLSALKLPGECRLSQVPMEGSPEHGIASVLVKRLEGIGDENRVRLLVGDTPCITDAGMKSSIPESDIAYVGD